MNLYQGIVVASFRASGDIQRTAYVLQAKTEQEARKILEVKLDSGQYADFRVVDIFRIQGVYRLWSRQEKSEEAPRKKSAKAMVRRAKLDLDIEPLQVIAVAVVGYMDAKNEGHARVKLGRFLCDTSKNLDCPSPLKKGGEIIIESQGFVDDTNTQTAERIGALNLEGRPLPGGLPSLGKKK